MLLNLAGIKLNAGGDAYAACLAVLYNPKSGSRTGAVGAVAAGVVCHRHRNLFCFAAGTVDVADASIRFVTADKERKAVIANLEKAKEGLAGKTGTTITA